MRREALKRFDLFLDGVRRYQAGLAAPRPPAPPVAWQSGSTRLVDYGKAGDPPVLVVPSLVNRSYVLDLTPERSLMRFLAGRGLRPLLVDWGSPGDAERGFDLSRYVTGPLQGALDFATEAGPGKPALAGYCMGGDLALALALRNPGKVAALALLATPWDFQAGQEANLPMLAMMAPALEAVIAQLGVLPTDMLQAMFMGLNPAGAGIKFRRFAALDPASDKAREFVALEDWLNDGMPLAGPVARECLFEWYLENTPMAGRWRIAGEVVDPARLDAPTLVVVPKADYIVPPESAKPLAELIPGARLDVVDAGHIGMVTGGGARKKLYEPLADWLRGHLS
ncbi:MAG: alpha/beta fold hydrolase [Rhodospirillaceae bacterium]